LTNGDWQLEVASSAARSLERLPTKVATAVVEFLLGPLTLEPRRVGHPLQRELAGLWTARCGVYRIVYELKEEQRTIQVLWIDHRSDVYRNH